MSTTQVLILCATIPTALILCTVILAAVWVAATNWAHGRIERKREKQQIERAAIFAQLSREHRLAEWCED